MKISIGANLTSGPWGGGNQFGSAMKAFLEDQGCSVCFDLRSNDIDIILLMEPRFNLQISAYNEGDIVDYLRYKNRRALVVHRVNESDQRKGTQGVNQGRILANQCTDHTVFVSKYLRQIYVREGMDTANASIIRNGADTNIFAPTVWPRARKGKEAYRLVTHHWGNHWLKGFDIYQQLDYLLGQDRWKGRIEFSYIGNLPKDFHFVNARHIEPLAGERLANELRSHDIYVTASRNEPAGMHHIEAGCCSLPLLYIDSGALPEYCHGFGVCYSENELEEKLNELITNYEYWATRMIHYSHTAETMCGKYYALFTRLLDSREQILTERKLEEQGNWSDYSRYWLRSAKRTFRQAKRKVCPSSYKLEHSTA